MLEIFVVFGALWWVALSFLALVFICALDKEDPVVLGFLGIISLCFLWKTPLLTWMLASPWNMLTAFLIFIACGVLWAIVKWLYYIREVEQKYLEWENEWLVENKIQLVGGQIPAEYKADWQQDLLEDNQWSTHENGYRVVTVIPLVKHNLSRISLWMLYWLPGVLRCLTYDLLKNTFDFCRRLITGFLDNISKWMFRNVKRDFDIKR